jgi:hypothetical protein
MRCRGTRASSLLLFLSGFRALRPPARLASSSNGTEGIVRRLDVTDALKQKAENRSFAARSGRPAPCCFFSAGLPDEKG